MRTKPLNETSLLAAEPQAEMERMYIAEFLKSKGYTLADLARLPEDAAKTLMEAATTHASLRLAELEMGSALVGALHHYTAF